MKRTKPITIIAFLISCILTAGCSKQQGDNNDTWEGVQAGMDDLSALTERTEYYDIVVESDAVFQQRPEDKESSPMVSDSSFVGMQFYQDEPVQLWMEKNLNEYGFVESADLYLYLPAGSRELLLKGLSFSSSRHYHCFLDQDGNIYCWNDSAVHYGPDGKMKKISTSLAKYQASGELLFETSFDQDITDICQMSNGKIYIILTDKSGTETGSRKLAELDPAAGCLSESNTVPLSDSAWGSLHLGAWQETPITFQSHVLSGNQITAIDIQQQAESPLLSFTGTSYMPPNLNLCDFRMQEKGSAELLWSAPDGSYGLLERLQMTKVEKTPIVLRGWAVSGLTAQVASFNQKSSDYHVILEDCGLENDREDFARLTNIQIAAGKGPDILCGSLIQDSISDLMDRNALEDLAPYMKQSDIQEEDYFPFAFSPCRDGSKIYGICPTQPYLNSYLIDRAVLGGTVEPDIYTLVDALLSRQEDSIFLTGCDSQALLDFLLAGSDNLWGMVDWESGRCDFSGELFAKILETAKRYGDNGDRKPYSCLAEKRNITDIFLFDSFAERERDQKSICGVLFDDGCHAAAQPAALLAINTNSANKEGAWEFLRFLLEEEAQTSSAGKPVSRKVFDAWLEKQKALVADGKEYIMILEEFSADGSHALTNMRTFTEADLTEEKVAEYIQTLEEARSYPLRTVPILSIIGEEAAAYFSGSKSIAQVAETTANRVQLYLDERR